MKNRFRAMSSRTLKIAGSILAYVLILAVLLLYAYFNKEQHKDPVFGSVDGLYFSDIVMEYDGEKYYYRENEITNYLLIGLDRDSMNQTTGQQNGSHADFLLVLSVDRINRTITPVMLDRDTMTPADTLGHPSDTQPMRLGLVQAYSDDDPSGNVNIVRAVESLFYGVKIDHFITVDISTVASLNDAIGGVDVTLEDDFTEFDPAMIKGATIRLNGEQAAFFLRGGTNASHMMQRQYISSFLMQFHQRCKKDTKLLTSVMETISGHIQGDTSLLTLRWDMGRYTDYLWQPIFTPEGSYTIDKSGFSEFWIEQNALQNHILEMWFEKAEQ